jgi:hypothetical protein
MPPRGLWSSPGESFVPVYFLATYTLPQKLAEQQLTSLAIFAVALRWHHRVAIFGRRRQR